MKYEEITEKIIGCAMSVHSFLGNGFQEVIYQRALSIEFRNVGLKFEREQEQKIYYRDFPESIGTRRVDFLVDEKILVEIKAISELNDIHLAQILNYLTAYKLEVGLLINFGEKSLKFKRLIKSQNQGF
jgi:GxxExxY protein